MLTRLPLNIGNKKIILKLSISVKLDAVSLHRAGWQSHGVLGIMDKGVDGLSEGKVCWHYL